MASRLIDGPELSYDKQSGEKMSNWMFYLGSGDDLTSTPKERRNLSAAPSASAPKEHILQHGQI